MHGAQMCPDVPRCAQVVPRDPACPSCLVLRVSLDKTQAPRWKGLNGMSWNGWSLTLEIICMSCACHAQGVGHLENQLNSQMFVSECHVLSGFQPFGSRPALAGAGSLGASEAPEWKRWPWKKRGD